MVYKIIKSDNYLLVVDDKDKDFFAYDYGLYKNYKLGIVTGRNDDVLEFEGECIDESNLSKVLAHLPLKGSPILEGVDLLDVNLILNYLKEFGYWNDFCTFAETFYNEKKHNKDTN